MKRIILLLLALAALALRAQDPGAAMEKQVAEIAAGPHVTVVHFWAPWCPNCKAEMGPDGWAKFIAANPGVKFVFINIWHKGQDPAPKLAAAGLGAQPNLTLLTHPNSSSREADKLRSLLGLPVAWIPTTWIFRDGRMRYALNYGEMHFDILQTLTDDARDKAKWARD